MIWLSKNVIQLIRIFLVMCISLEMYLALGGLFYEIYLEAIIYHKKIYGGKQVREDKLIFMPLICVYTKF